MCSNTNLVNWPKNIRLVEDVFLSSTFKFDFQAHTCIDLGIVEVNTCGICNETETFWKSGRGSLKSLQNTSNSPCVIRKPKVMMGLITNTCAILDHDTSTIRVDSLIIATPTMSSLSWIRTKLNEMNYSRIPSKQINPWGNIRINELKSGTTSNQRYARARERGRESNKYRLPKLWHFGVNNIWWKVMASIWTVGTRGTTYPLCNLPIWLVFLHFAFRHSIGINDASRRPAALQSRVWGRDDGPKW